MSVLTIIYTILIMPLQLFFEVVFAFAQRFTGDPGISIVVLSLTVNFLVLPIYKRADAIQAEQRDIEQKMAPEVKHIKQVFSGDEKMLILQSYYKHKKYKPTDVFKESISLLLQIPFFIAAYRFLSNLSLLDGATFGPLTDLGQPDGLLIICGISINLLPILMTFINVISIMIYTNGLPTKSKVQLYSMAAIFLLLLYQSPAGLVFYWTLNNLFSLTKNVFFKLRNPKKALVILFSLAGILLMGFSIFFYDSILKRKMVLICIGILLQVPFIVLILRKLINVDRIHKSKYTELSPILFLFSGLFLTILIGALIPSEVIKASPQEFINVTAYKDPLWNVIYAICLAFGTFIVWTGVFYMIANKSGRYVMERLFWVICSIAAIDYMFFGRDLGLLYATLQFENDPCFSKKEIIINIIVLIIATIVMVLALRAIRKTTLNGALIVAIITVSLMFTINVVSIEKDLESIEGSLRAGQIADSSEKNDTSIHFDLSKRGKNVILIMLDRAVGPFIPYIMNEKPELREKFDGFVYYSNSISFGGYTNFGTPALYGGYEYTPVEINKRDKESLKDKQNEALKVLPVLFNSNGFEVTVCDPTYANYSWIPDLSIYDGYPDIKTYNTEGRFTKEINSDNENRVRRSFFMYGIMKAVPLLFQKYVYDAGNYKYQLRKNDLPPVQTVESPSKAVGIKTGFMTAYTVLENLDRMTRISSEEKNTFLMMSNNTTHETVLLQEPEYEPTKEIDNEKYDSEHKDRFNINGRRMKMDTAGQYAHYETNMAAMIQLGKWFDYMRDNGVYDNTRIILVSDHGSSLEQFEELDFNEHDLERYTNLLMVKDFDDHGFDTSDEFMTTGDVVVTAMFELIETAENPFTGKIIDDSEKFAHDQYVITSMEWETKVNNGNQFLASDWLAVNDNVWDKNNWRIAAKNTVFTGE